ncbi:unnamed protein product [Psylliodes chrysocephalus]|uniref:Mutator-like transposase domain-containing protein n=1 Tax=Psylliodes chrysocephalus TaxID=3402493 RepID=A0A9P0CRF4_9CUCU|nr:unnamed protein product [Psylliodes chrysocephala]
MSFRKYSAYNELVSKSIFEAAWEAMKQAGLEELQLAKDVGEVDEQGNGLIAKIVDSAWSKRSYTVNYNASSGVACIIGAKTGKVFYDFSKSKYYSIFAQALTKNEKLQLINDQKIGMVLDFYGIGTNFIDEAKKFGIF